MKSSGIALMSASSSDGDDMGAEEAAGDASGFPTPVINRIRFEGFLSARFRTPLAIQSHGRLGRTKLKQAPGICKARGPGKRSSASGNSSGPRSCLPPVNRFPLVGGGGGRGGGGRGGRGARRGAPRGD